MKITIEEVAKLAKVSRGTASNVLNNAPFVKKHLRLKVLKAIEKLNYKPNHIARSLVLKKTKTIGLIVTDIMVSFFPNISFGVELFFSEKNYNIILCQSYRNAKKEKEKIYSLMGKKVDGLIIAPWDAEENIEVYKELENMHIPFVLIDCYTKNMDCNYVICDDYKGSFEAVEYLISQGHKKIAFLQGPDNLTTAVNRKKGYIDSMNKNNLELIIPKIPDNRGLEKEGYLEMKNILESYKNNLPTAIFAFTDYLATGAMKAIKESGLKIPEDISIIGFADLNFSELLGLSTVRQPQEELGKVASEVLLNRINLKDSFNLQKKVLPTQLIIPDTLKKI
jgi:LacI family transcriptional regulator